MILSDITNISANFVHHWKRNGDKGTEFIRNEYGSVDGWARVIMKWEIFIGLVANHYRMD